MQGSKKPKPETQPGLQLATEGGLSPQASKQAEKVERRKRYPVPPEAATNFRPAVGKELVEHALQASAAKRAKQSPRAPASILKSLEGTAGASGVLRTLGDQDTLLTAAEAGKDQLEDSTQSKAGAVNLPESQSPPPRSDSRTASALQFGGGKHELRLQAAAEISKSLGNERPEEVSPHTERALSEGEGQEHNTQISEAEKAGPVSNEATMLQTDAQREEVFPVVGSSNSPPAENSSEAGGEGRGSESSKDAREQASASRKSTDSIRSSEAPDKYSPEYRRDIGLKVGSVSDTAHQSKDCFLRFGRGYFYPCNVCNLSYRYVFGSNARMDPYKWVASPKLLQSRAIDS